MQDVPARNSFFSGVKKSCPAGMCFPSMAAFLLFIIIKIWWAWD